LKHCLILRNGVEIERICEVCAAFFLSFGNLFFIESSHRNQGQVELMFYYPRMSGSTTGVLIPVIARGDSLSYDEVWEMCKETCRGSQIRNLFKSHIKEVIERYMTVLMQ